MLKISNNNGDKFSDTHLPLTVSGQYINILDAVDQLIFAHVTDIAGKTL